MGFVVGILVLLTPGQPPHPKHLQPLPPRAAWCPSHTGWGRSTGQEPGVLTPPRFQHPLCHYPGTATWPVGKTQAACRDSAVVWPSATPPSTRGSPTLDRHHRPAGRPGSWPVVVATWWLDQPERVLWPCLTRPEKAGAWVRASLTPGEAGRRAL